MKLLIVHPFQRRRDPEAFAWIQALKGAHVAFVDRVRGETRRGAPRAALVEVAAWPSLRIEHSGISGRVLAGLGAIDGVSEALSSAVATHLLLLQTGLEHMAAAALAMPRRGLVQAVVVVECTDEALEALGAPFGRQLFWRFEGAARAQGAKLVMLAARDRETAAFLRHGGLPVARLPVMPPVGRGAPDRPPLDLLSGEESEADRSSSIEPSGATVRAAFNARTRPEPGSGGDPALWMQHLDSLGALGNGLWTKQVELDRRPIVVTDWRPA